MTCARPMRSASSRSHRRAAAVDCHGRRTNLRHVRRPRLPLDRTPLSGGRTSARGLRASSASTTASSERSPPRWQAAPTRPTGPTSRCSSPGLRQGRRAVWTGAGGSRLFFPIVLELFPYFPLLAGRRSEAPANGGRSCPSMSGVRTPNSLYRPDVSGHVWRWAILGSNHAGGLRSGAVARSCWARAISGSLRFAQNGTSNGTFGRRPRRGARSRRTAAVSDP